MDLFECIGIKHVKGTYNNIPYDNYNVYCIDLADINEEAGCGNQTVVFKFKKGEIGNFLQGKDPKQLIHKRFSAVWNRYQQIAKAEWMAK